ncbi:MAG: peptidoglycan DD-metalloendopeptidase family protein [Gemmatimonadetes bacterium]|uniref:Peptidoglycan DD-metalloendopeptidase family protein n=1 Tax=Candidatus Kutchimonas denitrificans TaxID=3056748 RepID=A0AAE4Z945_9BACT|nr:peptidoglycan DD-metalloendopeptidase family protein [Gemmatimonadota bacterium]NIR75559.1 peptidoglycan DD-metalloendopeptidase family protein [Candidatus Kutchimonas denitrificans]NIS01873.1 peptidoglycan DD-metalloendopeptidase family protein [Gemmatimonadota bacterium]NIT67654.1 peptidoglycan DD-metalloendopeptidase family protein [Gemmatimonadota bacterium]NIU53528.1 peptidoglycan DD-metalloendopeptidase family protein [Gemmatimonadota bacterium]
MLNPRSLAPACLALFVAAGAVRGQEDPIKPLEEQIRLSRQRLARIQEEKQRLRSEMNELSAQVHDVRAEIENLNRQTRNQETLLRELDHQLAIRDQLVGETVADLLRTQDQLTEKQVLFARRARDLYKRGPLASVQVLLAAESFSDLINRYQYLYLVALHDRLLVRQIEELKDQLEEHYGELRQEANGLREVRNQKVNEIQDLYFLERERSRRLRTVQGLHASTEQRLVELERDEEELNGLIDRLEREREAAEALAASEPTRSTITEAERGKLDWPVDGRLIYRFGRQANADGTTILRRGIGIAAERGAPVKAVAGGTVVFAQPYLSYGPSVILSHGGGYYSVYLYLSEILAMQGETVILGQPIGRVGGSETPEGAHLGFQIRINREAVDPLPWLKRRSGG